MTQVLGVTIGQSLQSLETGLQGRAVPDTVAGHVDEDGILFYECRRRRHWWACCCTSTILRRCRQIHLALGPLQLPHEVSDLALMVLAVLSRAVHDNDRSPMSIQVW